MLLIPKILKTYIKGWPSKIIRIQFVFTVLSETIKSTLM